VLDGVPRTALIADPRLIVERVAIGPSPARVDLEGMPLIVTALAQGVAVKGGDDTVTSLRPYETCLVPAAAATCTISAADAAATVLAIAPPREADALAQRLTRAGVPRADIDSFLGQFTHAP
jgi:hypothetical protein